MSAVVVFINDHRTYRWISGKQGVRVMFQSSWPWGTIRL